MLLKEVSTNACRTMCGFQETRGVRIREADIRLLLALRPELHSTTSVETSCPLPMRMSTTDTPPVMGEVLELGQKETHNESKN